MTGNWAYLSIGTWALTGAEITEPYLAAAGRIANYTNEGGLDRTIRFLSNITGMWLVQEIRRIWQGQGKDISWDEMDEMGTKSPAFQFLINPNDTEFNTPGDMPQKISDFCRNSGQGEISDEGTLMRAVLDSLALCFKNKLAELEKLLGCKYDILHIVGGGTGNTTLMQMTADYIGIPVIAGPKEAAAIGNVIAQAIGAGEINSLAAGRQIVKDSFPLQVYQPQGAVPGLAEAYEKFKGLL